MSSVRLQNRHLLIAAAIAADAFGESIQVQVVYYPQQQTLLLAPLDDTTFASLHQTAVQMLKTRNLQGDKSLSLEEILIDYELDDRDRDLPFLYANGMQLLHVTI
ncbi:MAG TPA: hypothetical protein PKL15_03910 [Saprospiraceae bacterium]|nr:hypothetical protein [Saprospiraceae bacterium]HNL38109.1 hypothetical protein [Saprospiraceae bacterium]HNM24546.1 hypothetical protein [Saprospiraceae bacterium]